MITDTEHYKIYSQTGIAVENLFESYCNKNSYIKCKPTGYHSEDNVYNGIDFYVDVNLYGTKYNFTVDIKSKYNRDTGNKFTIANVSRSGKPGTLQTSKADYYGIHTTYKGVDRFYLVKASLVKQYCATLTPKQGISGGNYYEIPIEWVATHWTFFIRDDGKIIKTKFEKYA